MSDTITDGDPKVATAKRRTSIAIIGVIALVATSAFIGYLAGQGDSIPDPTMVDGGTDAPTAAADPPAGTPPEDGVAPDPDAPGTAVPEALPPAQIDPEDADQGAADDDTGTGDAEPAVPGGPVPPAQPVPPPPAQPVVDGSFDPNVVYAAGDTVTYDGRTYTAQQETVGWTPTPDGHPSGAVGYGAAATGGAGGREVTVTSLADSGPGSLREAIAGDEPKWVRFDVDGTIEATAQLSVGANTTIDGRGADITISGFGLDIRETANVIVTNLTFDRLNPTRHEVDAIRVTNNSRDVWIDHVTISRINDEAINIGEFSTNVTVSWTHIFDQDRGILVGNHRTHEVSDDPSFATIHHTWFENLNQRSPRAVRWAQVNMVNSLVDGWLSTGASAAQNAQLVSQGNIFLIPDGGGQVVITKGGQGSKNPQNGFASSINDRVEGAAQEFSGTDPSALFTPPYALPIADPDATLEQVLRTHTGAQAVPAGGPWVQGG